jgi:hypothetical protein
MFSRTQQLDTIILGSGVFKRSGPRCLLVSGVSEQSWLLSDCSSSKRKKDRRLTHITRSNSRQLHERNKTALQCAVDSFITTTCTPEECRLGRNVSTDKNDEWIEPTLHTDGIKAKRQVKIFLGCNSESSFWITGVYNPLLWEALT